MKTLTLSRRQAVIIEREHELQEEQRKVEENNVRVALRLSAYRNEQAAIKRNADKSLNGSSFAINANQYSAAITYSKLYPEYR